MIKGEICLPAGTVEFQCHDLALKMTRFDILRLNLRSSRPVVGSRLMFTLIFWTHWWLGATKWLSSSNHHALQPKVSRCGWTP